jgi:hypothetical protein
MVKKKSKTKVQLTAIQCEVIGMIHYISVLYNKKMILKYVLQNCDKKSCLLSV